VKTATVTLQVKRYSDGPLMERTYTLSAPRALHVSRAAALARSEGFIVHLVNDRPVATVKEA
jgi:hypothetical protein